MPRIIRTSGLNLTDDVVKIKDITPVVIPSKPQPSPEFKSEFDDGGSAVGPAGDEETGHQIDYEASHVNDGGGQSYSGGGVGEEIIKSAMSEASRIVEEAVKAADIAREERLAGIEEEAERLRQEAATQGRKEGFTSMVGAIQDIANALEAAVARFEGERAGFETEYEDQVKWLAIEIASKVLAKKVSDDDTEMAEMVEKAVASVKNEAWIRVEVAQEMVGLINKLTSVFEAHPNIDVSPIPASPGTVQVETPSGVMDASLKTQLANLREYFATNLP